MLHHTGFRYRNLFGLPGCLSTSFSLGVYPQSESTLCFVRASFSINDFSTSFTTIMCISNANMHMFS